jgi:hypothetical protein
MKIAKRNYYRDAPPLSIHDAVRDACSESHDTRGVAECAQERADNAVEMLGRLLTVLHGTGKLTGHETLQVLGTHMFEEIRG